MTVIRLCLYKVKWNRISQTRFVMSFYEARVVPVVFQIRQVMSPGLVC